MGYDMFWSYLSAAKVRITVVTWSREGRPTLFIRINPTSLYPINLSPICQSLRIDLQYPNPFNIFEKQSQRIMSLES